MGRKWSEIIQLPNWKADEALRRCFTYATGEADTLIQSMRRAYPQCFDDNDRDTGLLPLSVVKMVGEDYASDLVKYSFGEEVLGDRITEFAKDPSRNWKQLPQEMSLEDFSVGKILTVEDVQYVMCLKGDEDFRTLGCIHVELVDLQS